MTTLFATIIHYFKIVQFSWPIYLLYYRLGKILKFKYVLIVYVFIANLKENRI